MQPVFFVMAILGCGDGSVDCTEARIIPARYETMAQCRADLANRIAANTDDGDRRRGHAPDRLNSPPTSYSPTNPVKAWGSGENVMSKPFCKA